MNILLRRCSLDAFISDTKDALISSISSETLPPSVPNFSNTNFASSNLLIATNQLGLFGFQNNIIKNSAAGIASTTNILRHSNMQREKTLY